MTDAKNGGKSDNRISIRLGLYFGAFVLLAAVLILFFLRGRSGDSSADQPPILGQVPEFRFVTQSNIPFGRAELLGKTSVVCFFFTRCHSICPVMSTKMAELYREYEDRPEIQFVSINVDPDNDSLPVLRQYAASFGVNDDRWLFLRGPLSEVADLSEKGFLLAADNLPADHSSRFVLVDSQARIRGYYDPFSDSSLIELMAAIRKISP